MRKIVIILVLLLTMFGCAIDNLMATTGQFENLPPWADGLELQAGEDHDGWSIYRNGIRYYSQDGHTEIFTPDFAMVSTVGNYCFILVTEFETIRFELDGDAIWIKWYNAE